MFEVINFPQVHRILCNVIGSHGPGHGVEAPPLDAIHVGPDHGLDLARAVDTLGAGFQELLLLLVDEGGPLLLGADMVLVRVGRRLIKCGQANPAKVGGLRDED